MRRILSVVAGYAVCVMGCEQGLQDEPAEPQSQPNSAVDKPVGSRYNAAECEAAVSVPGWMFVAGKEAKARAWAKRIADAHPECYLDEFTVQRCLQEGARISELMGQPDEMYRQVARLLGQHPECYIQLDERPETKFGNAVSAKQACESAALAIVKWNKEHSGQRARLAPDCADIFEGPVRKRQASSWFE